MPVASVRYEARLIDRCVLFSPDSCSGILNSQSAYFPEYKVLVDPGNPVATPDLIGKMAIWSIRPEDVRFIYYTHLHLDHIGAYWMFPNARMFASEEEMVSFFTKRSYFSGDEVFYSCSQRESLKHAAALVTGREYERDFQPLSLRLDRMGKAEDTGTRDGYFVFPSHTCGSTVISLGGMVFFGDIFCMPSQLNHVPRSLQEKVSLIRAARKLEKSHIISGHNGNVIEKVPNANPGMRKPCRRKKVPAQKRDKSAIGSQPLRHFNCDKLGRVVSEYYFDNSFQRVEHKDGYYIKTYQYNGLGKVSQELYFDQNMQPVSDSDGRYGLRYCYRADGRWTLLADLDDGYQIRTDSQKNPYACIYLYDEQSDSHQICGKANFAEGQIRDIKYFVENFRISEDEICSQFLDSLEMLG